MAIFLIALGLAADCFAVSLVCGVREKKLPLKFILQAALLFGIFQAGMTTLGYFFGSLWANYFLAFGHWISFALLAFVGGKMILEYFKVGRPRRGGCECQDKVKSFADIKNVLLLAVATSIDAFAVGVSFSFNLLHTIFYSAAVIGIITFFVSGAGFFVGRKTGAMLGEKAELLGGIVLILVGLKIVIDHYL